MTPLASAVSEPSYYHDRTALGFFAVLAEGRQSCYRLSELETVLDRLPKQGDVFLSQASFYRPSRRLVDLSWLGLCFADCETHKSAYAHLTPEQQAQALLIHCEETGLPRPSLINYSGRGLHVKWFLDDPLPGMALPRWNAVQKALTERLLPFAVDRAARDGSRCLRAVGSINPRSHQQARTVWIDEHGGAPTAWDFDLLANEVLPFSREALQEKRQARQQKKSGTGAERPCNLWPVSRLWWTRLTDLRKLIVLRNWQGGVPEGYRNHVLFIATCAVAWGIPDVSALESEVLTLAQEFTPTLSYAAIRSSTTTAIRKAKAGTPYQFTTERLLELLDIQPEEQRHLKTLIDADEQKRRKRLYDKARQWGAKSRPERQAEREQRRQQAQRLRADGRSYADIALHMGLTTKQVDHLLNR